MHNGERSANVSCRLSIINAVAEAKVDRQSSMLLPKPRLSVDCQCCCQSHVVIKVKEREMWQDKEKKTASTRTHTDDHFQVMFSFPSTGFNL